MDDLIVAAKGGVLVSKRVETVRTRGDDLWRADAVQQLDVALRLLLEAVLVADPPRRVTRAGLSRTEYRKGDASPLEQASKRLGGASPSVVERTGATSPVEVLDVVGDRAVDDTDGKVQLFVPRRPFRGTKTPRVATRLDVAQHRDSLRRHRRVHHHLEATKIDDRVNVLDVDRALLYAGATCGAGPEDVRVDDARHERRALTGLTSALEANRLVAYCHHEELRRQRLPSRPRRALALAAPTLRAGREIEQLLPAEVRNRPDAKDGVLVHRLDVNQRVLSKRAKRAGLARERNHDQVRIEQARFEHSIGAESEWSEHVADRMGYKSPPVVGKVARHVLRAAVAEQGHDHGGDHPENQPGGAAVRAGKTRLPAVTPRARSDADSHERRHPDQNEEREQIL